jgi:ubiquinone/menaquinone biosynthesis C-methylase UbiE
MRVAKAYKGIALEGMLATWYARNTAKLQADFKACAQRIAARLPRRGRVLEVAPGPGYLAVELARVGPHQITGLDISRSFVRMATDYAQQVGVEVEFRQGDAAALPFADDSFDFVVCRAAFKNFSNPVGTLVEMYRVLQPGGEALIIDMRNDATDMEIDVAVDDMHLDRVNAFLTRITFKHMLRKRAYSIRDFQAMVAVTPFCKAEIETGLIGLDVWLKKQSAEGRNIRWCRQE